MDFQTLFALGMKRYLPPLIARRGRTFDVGASGKYVVPGAEALGAPAWIWPRDPIPARNDSVATIHAYHFLEHLDGRDAIAFMREVERVLEPGGVFNYCVPYYSSVLAHQDLEHRSRWTEESFRDLFENVTYPRAQGQGWRLSIHFQVIVGKVQRNLALVGQIVKDAPKTEYPIPKWYYPESVEEEDVPST